MTLPVTSTPIQELTSDFLRRYNVRILVKRDDLTHPEVMGNKWRKLKYNIEDARNRKCDTIITYGGAYSNHIAATAAAARLFALQSIGLIRGDELNNIANPTLASAHNNGMKLIFLDRNSFQQHKLNLTLPFGSQPNFLILPEGGTNANAIKGVAELVDEIDIDYDILVTPLGTGGTAIGLLKGLGGTKYLWIVSALKGKWIEKEFQTLRDFYRVPELNYRIFEDKNFGGYGRYNQLLIQFILDFGQVYGILLDPIYTGKTFFHVWDMIKNGQIASGTTLLIVHTGGLQGVVGFNQRHNLALPTP